MVLNLSDQELAILRKETRTEMETDLLCARALGRPDYSTHESGRGFALTRWVQMRNVSSPPDGRKSLCAHLGGKKVKCRWKCTIEDIWPWVESLDHWEWREKIDYRVKYFRARAMGTESDWFKTKLDALKNLLIKVTWP